MSNDTVIDLGRPMQGDIIALILDDHARFEHLLRQLRDKSSDRDAVRRAFAALHVAHAEVEEEFIYPVLRKRDAIGEHEEEHGEEEHAEILEALEAFLEAKGTDTDKYDSALEELATAVNHHDNEEEQTILAPARVDVSQERRDELGVAFATRRNQLLEEGAGSLDQVRSLLKKAEKEGVIASEDAREKADDIKADAKEEAKEVEEASKEKAKKS